MYPQREFSHIVKSGFLAGRSVGAGDITEPRPNHLSEKVFIEIYTEAIMSWSSILLKINFLLF